MAQIKVHSKRDTLFKNHLAPEALMKRLREAFQASLSVLIKLSTGVGKTEGVIGLLASRLWCDYFTSVIIFLNSHEQIDELYSRFVAAGLSVIRYPQRDYDLCGTLNADMTMLEGRTLHMLAHVRVCKSRCPHAETCPYAARLSPDWGAGYDIIVAPEQLVLASPGIVHRWAKGIDDRKRRERPAGEKATVSEVGDDSFPPALVVFDEAKFLDGPLSAQFTRADVEMEQEVVAHAREVQVTETTAILDTPDGGKQLTVPLLQRTQELGMLADYLGNLLDGQLTPEHLNISSSTELFVQGCGSDLLGDKYKSKLHLILRYKENRLWDEDRVYAVSVAPRLPGTMLLMGAYLSPDFIGRRLHIPPPMVVGEGEIVRHPDSKVYNLLTTSMTATRWLENRETICNAAADFILMMRKRAQAEGADPAVGSVVLVTRKDSGARLFLSWLIKGVTAALARRGVTDITLVPAEDDQVCKTPDPRIVPVLTYGKTGINKLENYAAVMCCVTYHVHEDAVSHGAFGHMAPSRRPKFEIRIHSKRREIVWKDTVAPEDQQFAEELLFRLEADVALQVVSRVRHSVSPRIVVMSILHPTKRHLGEVVNLDGFNGLREALGLPTTKAAVIGPRLERAIELHDQGTPLRTIAPQVDMGYSTLKAAFKEAGVVPRRGRPRLVPLPV